MPIAPLRSRPRPSPPARPARVKAPGWGWLEWVTLAQTAIPALMFVPGLSAIRTLTRVGAYGLALAAWIAIAMLGRRRDPGSFPARPWLLVSAGTMTLSILNPYTNSLLAGVAHVALNLSIMAPAFWAGRAMSSSRQLPRILAILFVCNSASALVGVGQIYRPELFKPPKYSEVIESTKFGVGQMSFTDKDGNQVVRPSGLTDTPGAAAGAGQIAAIAGLCWALAPIAPWKRLLSFGLALGGLGAVYFTQVRSMLVMTALALVVLVVILALRGEFRRAALLGGGGAAALVAAFTWAVASMGTAISSRVWSLFKSDAYAHNRGFFLEDTFARVLPEYPLGAGLGRWGMMYNYFGDRLAPLERGPLYSEIQFTAWIYDGGVLLMVVYLAATLVALGDSLRIALRSKDRDLAYWAGVITALNLGTLSLIFNSMPFVAPLGIQFWLLAAALHAADRLARAEAAGPRRPPKPPAVGGVGVGGPAR